MNPTTASRVFRRSEALRFPPKLWLRGDGEELIVLLTHLEKEGLRSEVLRVDLRDGSFAAVPLAPGHRLEAVLSDHTLFVAATDGAHVLMDARTAKPLTSCALGAHVTETVFIGVTHGRLERILPHEGGIARLLDNEVVWADDAKEYSRWKALSLLGSSHLLVASEFPKKSLSIHDANTGALLVRHVGVAGTSGQVVSPSGLRLVAQTSTLKAAAFIDLEAGQVLKRPLIRKGYSSFAFSPDGALALATEAGSVVVLVDDAQQKAAEFEAQLASPQLAFTADGSTLVVVDSVNLSISLWPMPNLATVATKTPARTIADAFPLAPMTKATAPRGGMPQAKEAPPPVVEARSYGKLPITLSRPPSTLATHRSDIKRVLGRALPKDIAAFYEKHDGVSYECKGVGLPQRLAGLSALFDGFIEHRQFRSVGAWAAAQEEGELSNLPFCGKSWSEDFEVEDKTSLAQFNALVRSKELVNVAGASASLVIDFAPAKKKAGRDYQLAFADRGHELRPLDLGFTEFVAMFEKFGAGNWYLAYLSKADVAEMNIDVRASLHLEPFAKCFEAEVKALLSRAEALSS